MKITDPYVHIVNECAEAMLDLVEGAKYPDAARLLVTSDLFRDHSPAGIFKVTSQGRTRWSGSTLAGAIAAQVTDRHPPVRIWHINESGQRRLVLLDPGED